LAGVAGAGLGAENGDGLGKERERKRKWAGEKRKAGGLQGKRKEKGEGNWARRRELAQQG
jgi:hypothetical protein